jgi:hypothetical protein
VIPDDQVPPADDLRDAFRSQAAQAPDALAVGALIGGAVGRRHRRQQATAVVSVALAVTGLGIGVRVLDPGGRHPAPPTAALSVEPTPGRPTASTTSAPVRPGSFGDTPDQAIRAFFNAEYGYQDAVALGEIWNTDQYTAKCVGGQILRDGGTLPLKPGEQAGSDVAASERNLAEQDRKRYLTAGYTQAQAGELMKLWQETDIDFVETVAGQQLADGKSLPIPAPLHSAGSASGSTLDH